jgi:hypothetical protein
MGCEIRLFAAANFRNSELESEVSFLIYYLLTGGHAAEVEKIPP